MLRYPAYAAVNKQGGQKEQVNLLPDLCIRIDLLIDSHWWGDADCPGEKHRGMMFFLRALAITRYGEV
jgi:hypothetical protein